MLSLKKISEKRQRVESKQYLVRNPNFGNSSIQQTEFIPVTLLRETDQGAEVEAGDGFRFITPRSSLQEINPVPRDPATTQKDVGLRHIAPFLTLPDLASLALVSKVSKEEYGQTFIFPDEILSTKTLEELTKIKNALGTHEEYAEYRARINAVLDDPEYLCRELTRRVMLSGIQIDPQFIYTCYNFTEAITIGNQFGFRSKSNEPLEVRFGNKNYYLGIFITGNSEVRGRVRIGSRRSGFGWTYGRNVDETTINLVKKILYLYGFEAGDMQ